MALDRKSALAGLAQKLPTENQQTVKNLQSAQRVQMRQQLAGAQPGQLSKGAAQALAGQQTAAQGQIATNVAQQGLQQQNQLAQQALQQQSMANQQDLFGREQRIQAAANANANKLAQLSEEAKTKILDSRLDFQASEAQRKFMNTRQLADWKIMSAKSEQDFLDTAQRAQQIAQRNIQRMKSVYAKMKQALEQDYQFEGQQLDQEHKKKLYNMLNDYQEKIKRKEREAANKTAMWSGIGAIGGAVVGGMVGGPGGAAAGSEAGSGIGTGAGAMFG